MSEQQKPFWDCLLRAAETEPREATTIRGASGIYHPVIAVGVDEVRRRIVLISGEHDARTAAMAQVDIQTALENMQVLVARPTAVDFSALAKTAVAALGKTTCSSDELSQTAKEVATVYATEHSKSSLGVLDHIAKVPLNVLSQWMNGLQQLALINFSVTSEARSPGNQSGFVIDLSRLAGLDALELDNHYGVCPVPLYEFVAEEIEQLSTAENLDIVRDTLRQHHLLQYFLPPPDQLALGLIDRGSKTKDEVLERLIRTPDIGHPFSTDELLKSGTPLPELIDALQEKGLAVEGELGLEVGPAGRQVRTALRFKPREGLLSKLINRFTLNFDLKTLFGK